MEYASRDWPEFGRIDGVPTMKRILTLLVLTLSVTALCFAGSATGFVTDAKCATAGKAGAEHAGCAQGCLKSDDMAAVIVTEDGKIYEVADQAKIKEFAGEKVTVMGMIEDMKISSIESVEKAS